MFATISEALLALPRGSAAIASHLIEMGVKAECIDPSKCAVAEYLTRTTGLQVSVGTRDAAAVTTDDGGAALVGECVYFTEIGREDIAYFIHDFDSKLYPALIAEPVAA